MAKVVESLADDDDVPEDEAVDGGEAIVTDDGTPAAPEGVTLTPEQYADLQKKAGEGSSLAGVLEKLGERIAAPREPLNVPPAQAPTETAEQYNKRIEDTFLQPGKAVEAMREVIYREAGPAFQRVLQDNALMAKRLLLKGDDERPHFKQYKDEIEAEVAKLPAEARVAPGVWERAYDGVALRHQSDIVGDMVAQRVKEELAKRGITDEGDEAAPRRVVTTPRPKLSTQGGGAPSGGGRPVPAGAIKVTPAEEAQFRREALGKGMEYEDYVRSVRRG